MIHCCELMNRYVHDKKVPCRYYPIAREYGVALRASQAVQMVSYCPWCGKKLPKDLGDELEDILKTEYGIDDVTFDISEDPRIPQEFKSDAWWKKRGL